MSHILQTDFLSILFIVTLIQSVEENKRNSELSLIDAQRKREEVENELADAQANLKRLEKENVDQQEQMKVITRENENLHQMKRVLERKNEEFEEKLGTLQEEKTVLFKEREDARVDLSVSFITKIIRQSFFYLFVLQ